MAEPVRNKTREDHLETKRQMALRAIERVGGRWWTVTDVTPAAYGTGDPAENDPDFYARPRTWMYAPLIIIAGLAALAAVLYALI